MAKAALEALQEMADDIMANIDQTYGDYVRYPSLAIKRGRDIALLADQTKTIREALRIVAGDDPEYVVVTIKPTHEMQDKIWLAAQLQDANRQYTAMIAAAKKETEQ